jgi:hypothetical protein
MQYFSLKNKNIFSDLTFQDQALGLALDMIPLVRK